MGPRVAAAIQGLFHTHTHLGVMDTLLDAVGSATVDHATLEQLLDPLRSLVARMV